MIVDVDERDGSSDEPVVLQSFQKVSELDKKTCPFLFDNEEERPRGKRSFWGSHPSVRKRARAGKPGTAVLKGLLSFFMGGCHWTQDIPTYPFLDEIENASNAWWMRRVMRRRVLKKLAQDCAQFGPQVIRKAVELRAASAKRRVELLRSGDDEEYSKIVASTKESRLREILDETNRIVSALGTEDGPDATTRLVVQPELVQNGRLLPHQLQGLSWLSSLVDRNMSGILADDMGLGKTVQTLSFFGHLLEQFGIPGPHLLVVPLTTLPHWTDEIMHWTPSLRFVVFRGHKSQVSRFAQELMREIDSVNIVITTYETATKCSLLLSQFAWFSVVVDEGHRLKNHKTYFNQALRILPCKHRLLLTGTPLQNSLRELWSLLAFVAPTSFASAADFEQWFALPLPPSIRLEQDSKGSEVATLRQRRTLGQKKLQQAQRKRERRMHGELQQQHQQQQQQQQRRHENEQEQQQPHCKDAGRAESAADEAQRYLTEEEELLIIRRLHRVLRPFLLRRTKDRVLSDLPAKTEVIIQVPLSCWQQRLYNVGLRHAGNAKPATAGGRTKMFTPVDIFHLRKAVNHPYLCLPSHDQRRQVLRAGGRKKNEGQGLESTPSAKNRGFATAALAEGTTSASASTSMDEATRASGKLEFLDRMLPRLWSFGHKIIIFSQMSTPLDLVEPLLDRKGLRHVRIDGSMSLSRRQASVTEFCNNQEVAVALLTTRAGGVGLNLQVADTVILFDSDWNPQVDLQAIDRVHRIGQQRPVLVVRLLTPTGLDQGLLERNRSKRYIERKVISAGQFQGQFTDAAPSTSSDHEAVVRQLVREAARSTAKRSAVGGSATPLEEVNRLLARSPEERAAFDKADEALLGAPGADERGVQEGVAQRLERCGRLLPIKDIPDIKDIKRTRKGVHKDTAVGKGAKASKATARGKFRPPPKAAKRLFARASASAAAAGRSSREKAASRTQQTQDVKRREPIWRASKAGPKRYQ